MRGHERNTRAESEQQGFRGGQSSEHRDRRVSNPELNEMRETGDSSANQSQQATGSRPPVSNNQLWKRVAGHGTGSGTESQVAGRGTGSETESQVAGRGTGSRAESQVAGRGTGSGAESQVAGRGTGSGSESQVAGRGTGSRTQS
ncbi:PREDICTED: period circadian protein-like [Cyprinodon variegatus]|uniref:period circadian protein-like n=1 Tax=Cyprinodon variegatus TaxID=28743 RepID=UPI0007428610|nr:PREDICTED: period circadian protein-like [Cyprinodon variegatus]